MIWVVETEHVTLATRHFEHCRCVRVACQCLAIDGRRVAESQRVITRSSALLDNKAFFSLYKIEV